MSKDFFISRLCDVYGALLTEHRRDMLRSYYDYDLSLAEIAENSGITRQAVLDGIKQAEKQLVEYENRLGIIARADKLETELRSAVESLDKDCEASKTKLLDIIETLRM